MEITLLGAAGEVTGSSYLLQTGRARVLIDFGMFQGDAAAERRNRVPEGIDPATVDAVVLTHAHLDHCGRLPLLTRDGFRGPIHATPATIDLADLLLRDAARIEADDVAHANRRRLRAGRDPLEPSFTERHVELVLGQCAPLPYGQPVEVAPGVEVVAVEAGHLLGSVSLQVTAGEPGGRRTVAFSGDVGPRGSPILQDPQPIADAELVFLESTYGDRDHRSLEATVAEFTELVLNAAANRGKILVPAFAVGRAQEVLYFLAEIFRGGLVPPFPIFLDSPMAIRATEIYGRYPELADEEASALRRSGQLRRDLRTLELCETVEQSRALNDLDGPCLVIAGSGMANGGRILHHLRHNLWRPETVVLIVGYQAEGTLGRQLVEGAKKVAIFGEQVAVRADVHSLGGFSAHAGQSELLEWLVPAAARRPRVVLTHGEDRARQALAKEIARRFEIEAELPYLNDVVAL